MQQWNHQLPLKATAPINFSSGRLARGATDVGARDLLRELTRTRAAFLEVVGSLSSTPDAVVKACNDYLSILHGVSHGEANMRQAVEFKWVDLVSGQTSVTSDAQWERMCMMANVALWHAKHAVNLAQGASKEDDVAKEIYRSLRVASGVFEHLEKNEIGKVPYNPNTDFDERFVRCMNATMLAEAQEVTIERARNKGHKPDLIASLAHDNKVRFEAAAKHLESMNVEHVGSMKRYLAFKAKFYEAYALTYTGAQLFAEEKCGQALKAYQQARDCLTAAEKLSKEYQSKKSSMLTYHTSGALPFTENPLFKELNKALTTMQDKANRENGFIYHHKVPAEAVQPVAAKSLVAAEAFVPAEVNTELWSKAKFENAKIPRKGQDLAADKASSDDAKVVDPAHPTTKSSGDYCVVM